MVERPNLFLIDSEAWNYWVRLLTPALDSDSWCWFRFPNYSAPGNRKPNIWIFRNKRYLAYQEQGVITALHWHWDCSAAAAVDISDWFSPPNKPNKQSTGKNAEPLWGRSYSHAQTAESQSEPDRPDIPPHCNQNHPESSLSICRKRRHNQNVVYVLQDSSELRRADRSNTLETFTDKLRDEKPIIHLPLFGVLQFPSLISQTLKCDWTDFIRQR